MEISIIPAGISIHGDIEGAQPLLIEGRVDGSISIPEHTVTIGPNGEVYAAIVAREILVLGQAAGSLNASQRVEVRSAASATGQIAASRVSVAEDAQVSGSVHVFGTDAQFPARACERRGPRRQTASREPICIRPVA